MNANADSCSMKTLEKTQLFDFPFIWANTENYRKSDAYRTEIYLPDDDNSVEGLISLFNNLFANVQSHLLVYNNSWWDFCLDTWNINTDEYNYDLENRSEESRAYLELLMEAGIEVGYSGSCKCNDWNKFLPVVLNCITSHAAPYSPRFCDVENEFFFYFHHTGSIGLYYKRKNEFVKNILDIAAREYVVDPYGN
jgi:hypothetical protein